MVGTQALLLHACVALLGAMAATGAISAAALEATGAPRSAALLLGELAAARNAPWQRAAGVAAPLAEALLAATQLVAVATLADGGGAAGTAAAVLRAVEGMRAGAAGEAGRDVRRAQRVATRALDGISSSAGLLAGEVLGFSGRQ